MALTYINYNGTLYPSTQQLITADNRCFKYGDGLFESMRWMSGELRYAEHHAERLQRGMTAMKMEGGELWTPDFLRTKTAELVKKNRFGDNARVRFTIFRNPGGLYSPDDNGTSYQAEAVKTDEVLYKSSSGGFITDIFQDMAKPINILSSFKTCNSLLFVMAGIFRKENSLDDVLILNTSGFLCESMSSNVFVVYQGTLYTPALSEGCTDGVMRKVVIRLAAENGVPVTEAQINPAILDEAEEVFITNAARGIQWIMGLGKRRYFNRVSRELLEKLNKSSH